MPQTWETINIKAVVSWLNTNVSWLNTTVSWLIPLSGLTSFLSTYSEIAARLVSKFVVCVCLHYM
jgi:hypothetical protein